VIRHTVVRKYIPLALEGDGGELLSLVIPSNRKQIVKRGTPAFARTDFAIVRHLAVCFME
jgi:hypothetical protein